MFFLFLKNLQKGFIPFGGFLFGQFGDEGLDGLVDFPGLFQHDLYARAPGTTTRREEKIFLFRDWEKAGGVILSSSPTRIKVGRVMVEMFSERSKRSQAMKSLVMTGIGVCFMIWTDC